jgi:uncharacterized protein (TIGR02186 family)
MIIRIASWVRAAGVVALCAQQHRRHIKKWIVSALTILAMAFAQQALALPILADISSHRVEIHSAFTGTQLLVFGARNDPGDVVVIIRGPQQDFILRKKGRVAGIWINREQHRLSAMPEFYRIASSKELSEVRQFQLFDALEVLPAVPSAEGDLTPLSALREMLASKRFYPRETTGIEFMGPTLFKAVFNFPDDMPRGIYTAEAYLFTDGALSGMHVIPVEVYKIGTDAFIYDAAQHHSLLYGILAVTIALIIGSGASWLFRRV